MSSKARNCRCWVYTKRRGYIRTACNVTTRAHGLCRSASVRVFQRLLENLRAGSFERYAKVAPHAREDGGAQESEYPWQRHLPKMN